MQLQISKTRPFTTSTGNAVGYNAFYQGQEIEGVIWGHPLQGGIQAGTLLEVKEDNNIKWDVYKGTNRLNIREKASITILQNGAAAPTAQPPAPAYQQPPAAYNAPQQAPAGQYDQQGPAGNRILDRAAELVSFYVESLQKQGFSREEALAIGGSAPEVVALYWFGEKGQNV